MFGLPVALGVNVTAQLELPEPGLSAHVAPGANAPPESDVKLTLPPGIGPLPASVSVTVAEQLVGALATSDEGVQLTIVLVDRVVTVRLVAPELEPWVPSPG